MKNEAQTYEEWINSLPKDVLPMYTKEELELLYYFKQLSEDEQREMIEHTKIVAEYNKE